MKTILLIGDSGSGKTPQAGELAFDVYQRTGKFSVYYVSRHEHPETVEVLYDPAGLVAKKLGRPLLTKEMMTPDVDPWYWLHKATSGEVRDANGQWVKAPPETGCWIYDGASGFGEELLDATAESAKDGIAIGGYKPFSFTVGKGPGALKVGANNPSHFGVIQQKMHEFMGRTQYLSGEYCVWTGRPQSQDDAEDNPVLGIKIAGKAITLHVPAWFTHTFRIEVVTELNAPPKKRLYLQEHKTQAGKKEAFGNARYPLHTTTPLPLYLDDANLVEALRLIEKGKAEAATWYAEQLKTRSATPYIAPKDIPH